MLEAEPDHLPSITKDLWVEMSCEEVDLGPITRSLRLFPSFSKLKSIIITVCHLPNWNKPYSINTDHRPRSNPQISQDSEDAFFFLSFFF